MEDGVDLKVDSEEEFDGGENSNRHGLTRASDHDVIMDDMSGWDQPQVSDCGRCDDFDCMLPHADKCAAPYCKFIVCPKCQCLCATKASFDAHVESCLGLVQGCAPHYELHIVVFEEPPVLALCEICGMYRQRRGALLDAHRYICQRFIHEHDGGKFPLLPGELRWAVSEGAYTPPHYYHRLLAELKAGEKWSVIEKRYFTRSGAADCWQQMPCEAFRDLEHRAPVYPGAVMRYVEPADDDTSTDTSSLTSCSTTSTVTTASTGRASAAGSVATAAVTQASASPAVNAPAVREVEPPRQEEESRVAHVEPQRQAPARVGGRRVRRGRRSGQHVRERQRSTTPAGGPVGSTGLPAGPSNTSTPRADAQSTARSHAQPRDDASHEQGGSRNRRRRPRGPSTQQPERVVNDVGGGALEIVSPRSRNNSAERDGARGDARDVRLSPTRRHGRHLYLEGAIVDHRHGNFIASVLVCGQPPSGTSSVIRRNELERYISMGVASGIQVSYHRSPVEYQRLNGRTLSQARCQALLIDTATKMPAGCFWFWEPPPTNGEWLIPACGDACANPGAEHIKLRFSPLRRG